MVELKYGTTSMSIANPYDEVPLTLQVGEPLDQPLRILESFYREGMNSNSPAYQFLCFCKILEGVLANRVRAERQAKREGGAAPTVNPDTERIPAKREHFEPWLLGLFPTRRGRWDAMAVDSIFIPEAVG